MPTGGRPGAFTARQATCIDQRVKILKRKRVAWWLQLALLLLRLQYSLLHCGSGLAFGVQHSSTANSSVARGIMFLRCERFARSRCSSNFTATISAA